MGVVVGVSFFSSSSSSSSITRPPILPLLSSTPIIKPLLHSKPFSSSSSYYYFSFSLSSSAAVTTRPIMSMTNTNIDNNNNDKTTKRNHNNKTVIDTRHTAEEHQKNRRVLLFDVMDTIVRDPFYQDIPAFFGMSLKKLIDCKHPTAWIDFETGLIDEMELARNFFKDRRPFDLEGLKNCMKRGFSYLQEMEELLGVLKQNNYEMHASTNYPIWYEMIEDKLKLSTFLSWSFCSCTIGKRKPDPEFYAEIVRRLDIEPEDCIFIDDRMRNVEAAMEAGMVGLQFKDAKMLRSDLSMLGIQTEYQKDETVS